MQKTMFNDLPESERLRLLIDNCDSRDETSYMKDLSDEELDIKREKLTENTIQYFSLDEELKEMSAAFKKRMDPLKKENRAICEQVKTRKEEVNGTLFHFADHEQSIMNTYDERGEFVSSRRLRPEEKQGKLFVRNGGKVVNEEQ